MRSAVHEVILDKTIYFNPEDSKSNVRIPFSLKKDYKSLEFFCSYEPKKCEDKEKAKELVLKGIETYIPAEYRKLADSLDNYINTVVNLVTLSLDAPDQYLGCAHRHAPQQHHIISAEFSSPGFFLYSPSAGDWQVLINVHAVVSPVVRYHLQIFAAL